MRVNIKCLLLVMEVFSVPGHCQSMISTFVDVLDDHSEIYNAYT